MTRFPLYGVGMELRRPLRLEIAVGWGIILACFALLLAAAAALFTVLLAPEPTDWPARVRAVCEQYSGLDLAGLAPMCIDAGYQEQVAPEDAR